MWVEVRKLELVNDKVDAGKHISSETQEGVVKNEVVEEAIEEDTNTKIFNLIKEIDNGGGADTQDVITKSNVERAEDIIKQLLEQGEVFEIKPGKLKILE